MTWKRRKQIAELKRTIREYEKGVAALAAAVAALKPKGDK